MSSHISSTVRAIVQCFALVLGVVAIFFIGKSRYIIYINESSRSGTDLQIA